MPDQTNEQFIADPASLNLATSPGTSQSGNQPDEHPPDVVSAPSGVSEANDASGNAGVDGEGEGAADTGTSGGSTDEVADPTSEETQKDGSGSGVGFTLEDVSDPDPARDFTLDEVSDPLPENPDQSATPVHFAQPEETPVPTRAIASSFDEGQVFPDYTTPDGKVFKIHAASGRFEADCEVSGNRVASTNTDTIDEFYHFLNDHFPAPKEPFTGESAQTRTDRGIEGVDMTEPKTVEVPAAEPAIEVRLDYPTYMNSHSWFPTAINEIGGKIVDDSDNKIAYVLIHAYNDFKAEWAHLLKRVEETPEV